MNANFKTVFVLTTYVVDENHQDKILGVFELRILAEAEKNKLVAFEVEQYLKEAKNFAWNPPTTEQVVSWYHENFKILEVPFYSLIN